MVDVVSLASRGARVIAEALQVQRERAMNRGPSQLVIFPPSYRRRFFSAFSGVPEWARLSDAARYMVAAVEWEVAVVKRYVRRFDVLPSRVVGQLDDDEEWA